MRILLSAYACEPGRGSEPGVGWNWALSLVAQGHEVWVLTRLNNRARIEQALQSMEGQDKARLHFLYYDVPRWLSWWKKGGRGVQLYYAMWQRGCLAVARRAQAQHRFDVVHHLTFGVWRQPSLLYRLGVPLIFGPVGGGEAAPPALRRTLPWRAQVAETLRDGLNAVSLLNPTLRACVRQAKVVVAKTPETTRWLQRAGAARCHEFLEIGIDQQRLTPRGPQREAGQPLRCLYAGRLIGLKGVHLAIDAVARAVQQGADITFSIVGEGPLLQDLRRQVQALGLEQRIRFLGWMNQSDLFAQYRAHDALLFTSLHDSSGNVVLEAMAHGLPVICLKAGGPAMMVDSACGFAVDPSGLHADGVIHEVGVALSLLSTDPARWQALRAESLARAKAASWAAAASKTYALLHGSTPSLRARRPEGPA